MQLSRVTRDGVLSAIEECDRLGRESFLEVNGFREALEYYLLFGGNVYDSKAIAGVAHRFDTGEVVRSGDFTGGEGVASRLKELGFTVTGDADWQWFELLVAADVLHEIRWQRTLRAYDAQVIELSQYLRSQRPELGEAKRYRSLNSVQQKLENMRTVHPSYSGKPTKGGRLTAEVVGAFVADPDRMHELALTLRRLGQWDDGADPVTGEQPAEVGGDSGAIVSAVEGRIRQRLAIVRERDPKLRKAKIQQSLSVRGDISCETCGFNFEKVYGDLGEGFVHVHHVVPLHFSGAVETTLDALVLLCANCHQMIHRGKPRWRTPAELRSIIERQRLDAATR